MTSAVAPGSPNGAKRDRSRRSSALQASAAIRNYRSSRSQRPLLSSSVESQRHVQHAAGVPLGANRQPTALENAEHGAVLGEHISFELHDTVIPRDLHQVSKQQA